MKIPLVNSSHPKEHAKNIEEILGSLKRHCRSEISLFNDPHGKALLETSAEVLGALEKSFHDFIQQDEAAWRDGSHFSLDEPTPQQSIDPWD
jgi:hypothetical protein